MQERLERLINRQACLSLSVQALVKFKVLSGNQHFECDVSAHSGAVPVMTAFFLENYTSMYLLSQLLVEIAVASASGKHYYARAVCYYFHQDSLFEC